MVQHGKKISGLVLSFLSLVGLTQQQMLNATTDFTTWARPSEYPDEQPLNVSRYLEEARALSEPGFGGYFQHRCIRQPIFPTLASGAVTAGWADPYPAFDGLLFVGSTWVSSWAIDTGEGLILIDTLDNPDEAREVIIPGLQKFGYQGSDIRAAIVTHDHADHYGGARWLQDTFGTPVYMSAAAWDVLPNDPIKPEGLEVPIRNMTAEDGVEIIIGNTTITPVATPGHTDGTISLFFPVNNNGRKHVAGLYGGGGIPATAEAKEQQIQSFKKFADMASERGADVLLSNHPNQDDSIYNFEIMKKRPPGPCCGLKNPFIVGSEDYVRYLQMNSLCVRVQAARQGQVLFI